jgi:hypothetical protein
VSAAKLRDATTRRRESLTNEDGLLEALSARGTGTPLSKEAIDLGYGIRVDEQ